MTLYIKPVIVDGVPRVEPDTMAILTELSEHRELCEQCATAFQRQTDRGYCATGVGLSARLIEQPNVSVF